MDEPAADQILAEFARRLPPTIRDVVLARCVLPFRFPLDRLRQEPMLDLFLETLADDNVHVAARIAMVCGVMELALETDPWMVEFKQDLATDVGGEFFQTEALRAPMQERHFDQERDKFAALRAGPLSSHALRLWQNKLAAEQSVRG